MGFEGALAIVCQHFNSPLAEEFARTLHEMELGLPRRDAFQNLKRRTEVPELSNFVLALLQADALGIPIGRVLKTQAGEMRMKRRQWAREKAAKLPVKMLFPLVAVRLPGHHGRHPRAGGLGDLAGPEVEHRHGHAPQRRSPPDGGRESQHPSAQDPGAPGTSRRSRRWCPASAGASSPSAPSSPPSAGRSTSVGGRLGRRSWWPTPPGGPAIRAGQPWPRPATGRRRPSHRRTRRSAGDHGRGLPHRPGRRQHRLLGLTVRLLPAERGGRRRLRPGLRPRRSGSPA